MFSACYSEINLPSCRKVSRTSMRFPRTVAHRQGGVFKGATMKKCSVDGCEKTAIAKELCWKHYMRYRHHGDANFVCPPGRPLINSYANTFDRRYTVNPVTGCWEWNRYTDRLGYARLLYHGKMVLAHRFSYERKKGEIPKGLELDHLCRNPKCVNPDHLEAVTHAVNVQRGLGNGFKHKTHCKHGHEFTKSNTIARPNNRRGCKACRTISDRNRYRKKAGIPIGAPPQKRGPKPCTQQLH